MKRFGTKNLNEQNIAQSMFSDLKSGELLKVAPLPFVPRPQDLQAAYNLLKKTATYTGEKIGSDVKKANELILNVLEKTIEAHKKALKGE